MVPPAAGVVLRMANVAVGVGTAVGVGDGVEVVEPPHPRIRTKPIAVRAFMFTALPSGRRDGGRRRRVVARIPDLLDGLQPLANPLPGPWRSLETAEAGRRIVRTMSLIGVVAAFLIPVSALAAGPSSVPDHPWTLRGDFTINTASDPLPGDAVLAVSLARRLSRNLAVEGTVGPGLPSTMLARDARGATREVDTGSGLHAALLLRADR